MFPARNVGAAAVAVALAGSMIVTTRAEQPNPAGDVLAEMNLALANAGSNMRIDRAEISVTRAGIDTATTIFANDRTHQVESLFVANDPRRHAGTPDDPHGISYLVDQSDGRALAFKNATGNDVVILENVTTEPLLDFAMQRWQTEPSCPGPAIRKVADTGADPDLVDGLINGDPTQFGTPFADITHAGWLPPAFFDKLAQDGSKFILGVTFTLVFTDDDGNPTDLDNNGRTDTGIREIYYNRGFGWSEGPSRPRGIDIDSVATHESGHAFGLGHFGKIFADTKGNLKFAPRAVMNAAYVSPFASLVGTDNASFCQIWAHRK
jgi:hypothetical protein